MQPGCFRVPQILLSGEVLASSFSSLGSSSMPSWEQGSLPLPVTTVVPAPLLQCLENGTSQVPLLWAALDMYCHQTKHSRKQHAYSESFPVGSGTPEVQKLLLTAMAPSRPASATWRLLQLPSPPETYSPCIKTHSQPPPFPACPRGEASFFLVSSHLGQQYLKLWQKAGALASISSLQREREKLWSINKGMWIPSES